MNSIGVKWSRNLKIIHHLSGTALQRERLLIFVRPQNNRFFFISRTFLIWLLVLLIGYSSTRGASFRNLGFDEADTTKAYREGLPLQGDTGDFLPGWKVSSGTNPVRFVTIDIAPSGFDLAILYSTNAAAFGVTPLPVVEDRFSLSLVPRLDTPYTLEQTGELPSGAQAIHFLSYYSRVDLRINGIPIPLVYVPRPGEPAFSSSYDVYGDISSFEGQTAELVFSTVPQNIPALHGLDSISFIVPEPSSLILSSAGLIILGLLFSMNHNRSGVRTTRDIIHTAPSRRFLRF
jgi:hypothetical protein